MFLCLVLYTYIYGIVGGDYLGDGADLDDDELTRDKVKRASTQLVQQQDKRKRKLPKKKEKEKDADKE